jgi:glycosyltransferase involved in cell wall biosynthesis
MKIAILGTRGIPNHYGGFEQYAELLSVFLVKQGFDVTVYNSHNHPYQELTYKGVTIKHIFDPEKKLGTIGQFFYDLGCILDTRRQKFDLVYQLGYTSSAVFNFLFPDQSTIVTNMDGMEWKRSKYNKYVQRFLKYSERIAVKRSHFLVADSLGVKDYLDHKYPVNSFFSAYTADVPETYTTEALKGYGLVPGAYHLLIARLEPENNVDTIMEAHTLDGVSTPLIVIGNHKTKYGAYLTEKYKLFENIRFIGAVYDKESLNSIRHYSRIYFHGHSVGGTNPSLLEAMACSCNIIAHNNVFNNSVLGDDAWYFNDALGLNKMIVLFKENEDFFRQSAIDNLEKIKSIYSEEYIFKSLKEKLIEWRIRK